MNFWSNGPKNIGTYFDCPLLVVLNTILFSSYGVFKSLWDCFQVERQIFELLKVRTYKFYYFQDLSEKRFLRTIQGKLSNSL